MGRTPSVRSPGPHGPSMLDRDIESPWAKQLGLKYNSRGTVQPFFPGILSFSGNHQTCREAAGD